MKIEAATFVFGILIAIPVNAQPYQFDQNEPAPKQVVLFDDPENEGVKLGSAVATLNEDAARLFINGLIEYQPVDIFVAPVDTERSIDVDLVKATWQDVVDSCTATMKQICQFSVRTLGDVGIAIAGQSGTEYAMLVVVGEEIRPLLDSPFYEITKADLAALESSTRIDTDARPSGTGANTLMYVLVAAVFVLLLAVVFLLGKRSRQAMLLAFAVPLLWPEMSSSQEGASEEPGERVREEMASGVDAEWTRFGHAQERLDEVTDVADKVNELRDLKKDFDEFWSGYSGLGDCINTGPAWSARERIPSFCADQEGCDKCFLAAREQFNLARYYLGRLKTIHSCTIRMTDSAKAFGDSFSSATKSGLGWYEARQKIEKSVENLNKAYDKKYVDLMGDLGNSMADMSVCEAQYGLEDWYDRFGFVYYEFMKDKYKRN